MSQMQGSSSRALDKLQSIRVFNGAQLKYIAMFSMLLDHVNKAILYPYINSNALLLLSDVFEILGRIAYPLFLFFLVEGFFKTGSRAKYLLHLLIFAVISEVPFDLFTTRTFFEPNGNNILFTFAMVLLTLWSIDVLRSKLPKAAWYPVSFVMVAVMCFAAMLAGVDYEYHAILGGYFFYLFHETPPVSIPFAFASMYKEPWALLGFGLTLTYNGERGRQHRWLNYAFYPAHLLVLGLLRLWLDI